MLPPLRQKTTDALQLISVTVRRCFGGKSNIFCCTM